MKYNVIQFSQSKSGYAAKVISTHDNESSAFVKYHQTLAALHNDKDTIRATVKIENEYGHEVMGYMEMVEHETEENADE